MVEYRKATIEDINELVRNRIDFIREAQNIDPQSDVSCLEKSLLDYFHNTIKEDAFIAWVAMENSRVVATSGLCFHTVPPSYKNLSGNIAYIVNMYTEPAYRNRGIASVLFEKIVEEAKSRGYKKISLNATENGRPLYIKYGFKDTGNEMVLNI